jgi:hypothetical protein
MAVRSMTAGAERMILAVRSAAITPATIGAFRSVLQRIAPPLDSAWSVIVCGRAE